MTPKPFTYTASDDPVKVRAAAVARIPELEAELAHLRSLLPPGLRVIDQTMAERDLMRAQLAKAVQERDEVRAENNLLRAQLAKTVRERDMLAIGLQ